MEIEEAKNQKWKERPLFFSLCCSVWRKTCNGRILVGFIGAVLVLGFALLLFFIFNKYLLL